MDENAEERGPHTDRKVVSSSEITTVTLECRHADNRYFVGEDAVIQGLIYNYDAVRDMAWKRKTDTGCHSKIDTTLPKYQGSTNDTLRPELMIRNCVESDAGPYFIQVSCTDMEICSKDFFLEVLKGPPLVALNNENKEEKAFLNESKEIRATIRGYPKYNDVIWMKDSQRLDITDPHYEGSQTDGMYAVLCINNVKIEDTGTYEIEVHNEEGKNCSRQTLKVIGGVPEVTLNKISPVHPKTCVTLEATIRNVFECDSVIWRKHDHSYHDPKFEFRVDINQNGSVVMRINDVRKEDAGTYTIEAHNKYGKGQSSKELKVIGGFPLVTIQKVPLAYLNDCVELKAKIKGFPKVRKVNWLKDNQKIDMTDTKYEGSKDDGDSAVLCIKDVEENDEAIYTVEVSNELKKAERSQKLMVIREGQMIFISGPVVVSPSDTINFHVYMSSQTISNIQWWKINGVSKIEVEFDNVKYKLTKEGDNIYEFEITNAKSEDSGSYQCTADNMKSNTIYVYVNDSKDLPTSGQGNVIRFYALQAVSAKAMRKAIDRMPGRFHSNLQRAKTVCQSNKQQPWAKEFISISPNNSDGMDISKMYTMYRNLHQNSRQWGQPPRNNETFEHDDIERIRLYRNRISHSDAKEIETPSFNKWMLDLLGAIQRLSRNDREVIKESCVILTRVFTTVEFKEKMETFKEEPENLGLNILNEEEEITETTLEEEIEMLNQTSLNKEHHGDTQRTDRSNRREETTFHDVCDSDHRKILQTEYLRWNVFVTVFPTYMYSRAFVSQQFFISDNFVGFGIAVLIAISILHLLLTKDKIIKIQIKGQETAQVGDTVCLTGNVEFHPSVKYLKWQKYHNGYFVDININKSKYQGSTKNLQNPRLVINDVDQDDEADYRLEVQLAKSSQHSNIRNVEILSSTALETPTIRIYPDEPDGRYYVGEDVTIKASIRNPLGVLCVTWQKETEAGTHTINTALPKYKETSNATDVHHLLIRDCNDSDQGGYFLLAACNYDQEDARSNKIYLNIVKGPPIVTLSQVSETVYEKPVEFKAAIRIFPKQCDVNWLRGSQQIDINQPKYAGSTVVGASPVLWINEVNKDDEGDYSIEVINKEWEPIRISKKLVVNTEKPTVFLKISEESDSMNFGNTITLKAEITASPTPSSIQWIRINKKGKNEEIKNKSGKFLIKNLNENCQTLRIENLDFSDNGKYKITVTNAVGEAQNALDIKVGGDMIFIAGPTVVAPTKTIKFRTEYHISESFSNPMWLKIKHFQAKEIVFDGTKYSVYNSASTSSIKNQKFVIADAEKEGDTAAYQLALDNMRSNKLNIFVDNCGEYSTEKEGNCLRFFALQTVSTKAMRIAFDKMQPAQFKDKIKEFKRYCKSRPNDKRTQEQLLNLTQTNRVSSADLDISIMYTIIRNVCQVQPPKNGWGKQPNDNDTDISDDIERIRHKRNLICHENALNMETSNFNKSALDLIRAIRRLTLEDVQIIEDVCDVLNKVFTKGEIMEEMIQELRVFQKNARKWEELCQSEELQDEAQSTNRDIELENMENMGFHFKHDRGIIIGDYSTLATNRWGIEKRICFMNRPMKQEEEVHIRGGLENEHWSCIHIGLTNVDPATIPNEEDKKKAIRCKLQPYNICNYEGHGLCFEPFHLCISLCKNATLLIHTIGTKREYLSFPKVSPNDPVWLVIELFERGVIWITPS